MNPNRPNNTGSSWLGVVYQSLNINQESNNEDTPFYRVVEEGKLKKAKKLLENGANVDEKDNSGCTSLHLAIKNSKNEVETVKVKWLLKHGANVNEKTKDGRTPLHLTLENRSIPEMATIHVMELLLKHGANVNEETKDGNTPLHLAILNRDRAIGPLRRAGVSYQHIELLKWLIKNGANVNEKTKDGNTPLHLAILNYDRAIRLFRRAGNSCQHIKLLKWLIKHGANVNEKNNNHETPLHWAARSGHLPTVELLISEGANKTAKCKAGALPWMVAISNQHASLYKVLSGYDLSQHDLSQWADDSTELHCTICMRDRTDPDNNRLAYVTLNCGHMFHVECVAENVSTQARNQRSINCPNCRTDISPDIVPFLLQ